MKRLDIWFRDFVHNCLVHPLLPFLPYGIGDQLHNINANWAYKETNEKLWSTQKFTCGSCWTFEEENLLNKSQSTFSLIVKLIVNLSLIPLMFIYVSQLPNPTFWVTFPFMLISIYMIPTSYKWFQAAFENVFIQESNRTIIDSSLSEYGFFKNRPKFNLFWQATTFFCWIYWFCSTFQSLISLSNWIYH